MTEEESREAFEAEWISFLEINRDQKNVYKTTLHRDENGDYTFERTQDGWHGWQACIEWMQGNRRRCEVHKNEDGTIDEIVGHGAYHLEQMDKGHWVLITGDGFYKTGADEHIFHLTSKKRIKCEQME